MVKKLIDLGVTVVTCSDAIDIYDSLNLKKIYISPGV